MPQRRLCFLLGLAVGLYGGLATNVISDRVQLSRLLNHNLTVADVEALSDLDELTIDATGVDMSSCERLIPTLLVCWGGHRLRIRQPDRSSKCHWEFIISVAERYYVAKGAAEKKRQNARRQSDGAVVVKHAGSDDQEQGLIGLSWEWFIGSTVRPVLSTVTTGLVKRCSALDEAVKWGKSTASAISIQLSTAGVRPLPWKDADVIIEGNFDEHPSDCAFCQHPSDCAFCQHPSDCAFCQHPSDCAFCQQTSDCAFCQRTAEWKPHSAISRPIQFQPYGRKGDGKGSSSLPDRQAGLVNAPGIQARNMRPGHEYINTRGTPNSASCQEGNLASVSGPLPVQNDGTLPAYTPPSHFNSQKPEPTYRSSASGKQVPPSKTSPPLKVETPASMSPSKRNASTLWRVGVASTVLGVGVAARRWYGSRQSSRNPHGRPGGVPGTLLHRREVIGGAGAALSGAIYLALRYQRVRGRTSTDLDRLVTPTPVESKKTSYPSLLMAIVASVFATVIAVGIVIACAVSRRRRLQAANRLHDASDDYALFAKKLTVNSGTQF